MSDRSNALFEMPAYVIGRVMNKRGVCGVFERFEAPKRRSSSSTCRNSMIRCAAGDRNHPNINRLASAFRAKEECRLGQNDRRP